MKIKMKIIVLIGLIAFNIWLVPKLYKEIVVNSNPPHQVAAEVDEVEELVSEEVDEIEEPIEELQKKEVEETEKITPAKEPSPAPEVMKNKIKVMEKSNDFKIGYGSFEFDFSMDRESIQMYLGIPDSEVYIEGEELHTYDYFYEDIRFSFFPQTGDLFAISFKASTEILQTDWFQHLVGDKLIDDAVTITSLNKNTFLDIEVSENVAVKLYLNLEGPSFYNESYAEEETTHTETTFPINVIPHNSDEHLELLAREFVRMHVDPERQRMANYSGELRSREAQHARVSVRVDELSSFHPTKSTRYNVILDVRSDQPAAISMQKVE
ncbi:hypothetical protein [Bacillus sp. FJAT-45037]|uniref:hypothetical protein n=1 Tax=Bacillus sp. FJAT-45037 TaxID=2011007 RepID=UPI000C24F79E|nr:hypothetical protein [Bacillus sp. FJAT-45037]